MENKRYFYIWCFNVIGEDESLLIEESRGYLIGNRWYLKECCVEEIYLGFFEYIERFGRFWIWGSL